MIYFVYVLINKVNKIYIGQTNNLSVRLVRHNSNGSRYTKGKGPFQVIHTEQFETRALAMKRERELKSARGRNWIRDTLL
jgi:putative endonuclease